MRKKKIIDRYTVFREQYGTDHSASKRTSPLLFRLLAEFAKPRIDKVSSLLPPGKHRVLEIGCGGGNFLYLNRKKWKSLVGVDVLKNLIESARDRTYLVPSNFILSDFGLNKMPFKTSSFDLVISIATLQYIYDLDLLFTEIHRVLRPKGYFIFEVPNSMVFWKRLKFLLGEFPNSTEYTNRWDGGVIHYFTQQNLNKFLKQKQFKLESVSCSGIFDRMRDTAPSILGGDLIMVCRKQKI